MVRIRKFQMEENCNSDNNLKLAKIFIDLSYRLHIILFYHLHKIQDRKSAHRVKVPCCEVSDMYDMAGQFVLSVAHEICLH